MQQAIERFLDHYRTSLGSGALREPRAEDGIVRISFTCDKLKGPGNEPCILHHGSKRPDVIVLTHGLTDSPYYMEAIARWFSREGANVVLPLLPGHGLKDPDAAMQDPQLDEKWRDELDQAVAVASQLGERISLGGFSTGGALSLNKLLRDPETISGGLFLFSAAVRIGPLAELAGKTPGAKGIAKWRDGTFAGRGPNPYKYPVMSGFAGLELTDVIEDNNQRLQGVPSLRCPVFAAHSVHDDTAQLDGIIKLLEEHITTGTAFIVSQGIPHADLVLDSGIQLTLMPEFPAQKLPRANPQFADMMTAAITFFRRHVVQPVTDR